MSAWTRAELLENIRLTKEAYRAALFRKSYTLKDRALVSQELERLDAELKKFQAQLDAFDGKPTGLSYFRAGMGR